MVPFIYLEIGVSACLDDASDTVPHSLKGLVLMTLLLAARPRVGGAAHMPVRVGCCVRDGTR